MTGAPSQAGSGTPEAIPARCLVTGGAGFIGSHLVDHLLSLGAGVVVVDDLSTGRRENLAGAAGRVELIESDVEAALRGPLAGARFDAIFHLAASVGVRRVVERPIESIESNVGGAGAVFRYAMDAGPTPGTPARVLFASSSEVYGKSTHSPFTETDDCLYGPTSARRWSYAAGKALGEHLALAHHELHGLPVVVARLFNTVGPRQVGEYGMVLPRFVRAALEGTPLTVHGDGAQSRCFCDVRDVAPALVSLVRSGACAGKVFNVGSDQPITMMDLAGLVIETLGGEARIRLIPYDEAFGPGFEDLRQRRPDLTRVKGAIGFAPSIPLRRTILDVAEHIRQDATRESP